MHQSRQVATRLEGELAHGVERLIVRDRLIGVHQLVSILRIGQRLVEHRFVNGILLTAEVAAGKSDTGMHWADLTNHRRTGGGFNRSNACTNLLS